MRAVAAPVIWNRSERNALRRTTAHALRRSSGFAAIILGLLSAVSVHGIKGADEPIFGINLAGAEFGPLGSAQGTGWDWPKEATIDYWSRSGVRLVRLPFRWERMQPVLFAELDPEHLAGFDLTLARCAARGIYVIPDLHNYNHYNGQAIGSASVPLEAFADFWQRMADHLKDNPWIWGYGLMNEPWIEPEAASWLSCAQAAVTSIRSVDLDTQIVVANDYPGWLAGIISSRDDATAESLAAFMEERCLIARPDLLVDPSDNVCFDVHIYFDHDASGTYTQTYEFEINRTDGPGSRVCPEIGIQRMRPFVEWLKKYGARGLIGEYGCPANPDVDVRWLDIMENTLAYMAENGLSCTYWAAGDRWVPGDPKVMSLRGWPTSLQPEERIRDRPQLTLLKDYLPEAASAFDFELSDGHRIAFDFGSKSMMTESPDTEGIIWYNVMKPFATGVVSRPYLTMEGETLELTLQLVQPFAGFSTRYSTAAMVPQPTTAMYDSFLGGSSGGHEAALEKTALLRFEGLPQGFQYRVTLFASDRDDDSGNGRLTRFRIGSQMVDVEAASNAATSAVFDSLSADSGTLDIEISVSPDGTARYASLNTLVLEFLDTRPTPTWAGFPLESSNDVDTGNWIGWLWVGEAPWVYSWRLRHWIYLPESFVTPQGAWTYIP